MNHFNPVDDLGIHQDGIIEIQSVSGGVRKQASEQLGHDGQYVDAAAKTIRAVTERRARYALISNPEGDLTLTFGALAYPTSTPLYVLTGGTVTMDNGLRAMLDLTYVRFSATNLFNATDTKSFDIVIPCGFGVVDLLGCTVGSGGEAVRGTLQIASQNTGEIGATSGAFQVGGWAMNGYRLTKSLTATAAITLPSGISGTKDLQPGDDEASNTTAKLYTAQWFDYPTLNA